MGVARIRWIATAKPVCIVLAASWRAPLPRCNLELDVAGSVALGHRLPASATKWPSNAKIATAASTGNRIWLRAQRGRGLAMLDMVESLFEQSGHMIIVQTVEDLATLFTRPDEAHLAQAAHVVRYG
jgi:hypothetical protein